MAWGHGSDTQDAQDSAKAALTGLPVYDVRVRRSALLPLLVLQLQLSRYAP